MSKVLVIDDEPKIVSFVTRALTARGYDVDSADSGARGLELIRMGGYAVVVLDLRLPDIDGLDVLRSAMEDRPDQQVIVLSALPDAETKVQCLDLGAVDYITKPFSLTEFAAINFAAMLFVGEWETVPFHFVCFSLTLVYGFRVWRPWPTAGALSGVMVISGVALVAMATRGQVSAAELTEVPLMSAMFV